MMKVMFFFMIDKLDNDSGCTAHRCSGDNQTRYVRSAHALRVSADVI